MSLVYEERVCFDAEKSITHQQIHLWAWVAKGSKITKVVSAVEYKDKPEDDFTQNYKPTFALEYEDAERLMTSLWHAGIRPNHGEGTLSHVEAMKAHIKSLEKMIDGLFELYKKEPPMLHIKASDGTFQSEEHQF